MKSIAKKLAAVELKHAVKNDKATSQFLKRLQKFGCLMTIETIGNDQLVLDGNYIPKKTNVSVWSVDESAAPTVLSVQEAYTGRTFKLYVDSPSSFRSTRSGMRFKFVSFGE